MNKLKKQVIKMLKENTGKHFLDSGNAYGRNWERNQIREFEIEKPCNMEIDNYNDKINVEVTFNIYHYLVNHLELNQETDYLNKKFNSFINLKENKNNCYLTIMELFSVKILNVNYKTINTCNYDNLLSQVIQYVVFKWENEDYIILQIHNGCDVRGGYTKPYIFKITDYDYFTLAQYNANLFCQGETIKENGNLLIKNPKPITYTKKNVSITGLLMMLIIGIITVQPKIKNR